VTSEVARLHADFDAAAELRELAGQARGERLACARGCTGCCEEPILVYEAEARAVAAFLEAHPALRDGFLARYPAWRAAAGDAPARLAALLAGDDREAYEAAHQAAWRKRLLCAFNAGGDCTIYPVRPLVCRNGHAVGTAAACAGDAAPDVPVVRLTFGPTDRYFAKASAELRAAIPGAASALCVRVHELISSPR
jgi:hypothetical protein